MTIELREYESELASVAPEVREVLEGTFHEAARLMSPAGLHDYLEGAKGLSKLGRGSDLVISYLQEMPLVVKECGEDVIRDCINAALKLSSMASGEVVALLFASLPTAATRLGDPDLLRSYLGLIHQLSAKAPRGLRPLLNHLDELLSKLTLSGLRKWAYFGADAHRRDLENLVAYFGLETTDSLAMLQQQRRGTLFIDAQRKLNFYLRALWGRGFFLRPSASDIGNFKPYIDRGTLYLPDAVDDINGISGLALYRAMTAHLAAHLCYTTDPVSSAALSPAEKFFVGLVEDARVEYLAASDFPGLARLWQGLLVQPGSANPEHATVPLVERLTLALADPDSPTSDPDLDAIANQFHREIRTQGSDNRLSLRTGLEIFNLLSERRDVPSLRVLESVSLHYRDNNQFVWEFDRGYFDSLSDIERADSRQQRRTVSVLEMVNTLDCELAGDDAQEIWRLTTPFYLDQEGVTINELEGKEPISDPYHYPEWDYQVQLSRPHWTTVYERRQPLGDSEFIDQTLKDHKSVVFRIRQIVDALRPVGVQRIRNMEDGDEVDINAAVDAMIAIRMGESPSTRVTYRNVMNRRDLAVVILLDLSESTNESIRGSETTVLGLTRDACALLSMAISGIGDPYAIHGFASDGRHDVRYYRFKDFAQGFDEDVKSRLAGMQGGLSTRMGAAIRHAGSHLAKRGEKRKLLLIVTDGEPADVDERDPQHLRHDARRAVEELHARGVSTYCLNLDPYADRYVQQVFGAQNYTIIDHVDRLPEKLPALFASLTT